MIGSSNVGYKWNSFDTFDTQNHWTGTWNGTTGCHFALNSALPPAKDVKRLQPINKLNSSCACRLLTAALSVAVSVVSPGARETRLGNPHCVRCQQICKRFDKASFTVEFPVIHKCVSISPLFSLLLKGTSLLKTGCPPDFKKKWREKKWIKSFLILKLCWCFVWVVGCFCFQNAPLTFYWI